MKTYKAVYEFEVLDKLRNGVEVHVLDKESGTTYCMSKLNVMSVLDAIDHDNSDNRYEFWEEIDDEDNKTDE